VVTVTSSATAESAQSKPHKLEVRDLTIGYGDTSVLEDVSLSIREGEIFGIIGPANAGKTSFLKAVNRMELFNADMRVSGQVLFNGQDLRRVRNVFGLRRRIGVVFPLPVGLPLSVYDNVALAPRLSGIKRKKDPDLLMLDEFSIAVDPVTTMRIEEILKQLKDEITIILVTNLVQQARRIADRTAFFLDGRCIEIAPTEQLFTGEVQDERTRQYVEGRFG
jgi:phosphate transport system ATP-binding protein